MSFTTIILMLSFSLVMSITPGPVNLMIISSGINNGFYKTFSFISGATIGFTTLLILISFGFNTILKSYPIYLSIIEILGFCYIMYLSYQIVKSNNNIKLQKKTFKTLYFYEGFLLQFLNPKACLASISGVSMFSSSLESLVIFIIIYFIVCYLSLSFWGILGQKATQYLNTNKKLKYFNFLMAGLLFLISLYLFITFIS